MKTNAKYNSTVAVVAPDFTDAEVAALSRQMIDELYGYTERHGGWVAEYYTVTLRRGTDGDVTMGVQGGGKRLVHVGDRVQFTHVFYGTPEVA